MALGEIKNGIGPDAYAIYQQVLAAVVERDHPVGSLYISENATSPAELYGGTWERIEGRFIMGASDTYPAGSTGGSATHTQTPSELATHIHGINVANVYDGKYTVPSDEWRLTYKDPGNSTSYLMTSSKVGLISAGESNPMDILNPYYSMYIWRRVA